MARSRPISWPAPMSATDPQADLVSSRACAEVLRALGYRGANASGDTSPSDAGNDAPYITIIVVPKKRPEQIAPA
jgi:hypothetical protein